MVRMENMDGMDYGVGKGVWESDTCCLISTLAARSDSK
jgi:hypothetical protein